MELEHAAPRGQGLSPKIRLVLEPAGTELGSRLAKSPTPCRAKRSLAKQT
jgi:hypothetical protein